MIFKSENLKKYIIDNLDIKNENNIQENELNDLKELCINRLDFSLKEASFYPQELSYLKELEKIEFNMFLINDEIKENMEKLISLRTLDFDFCRNMSNRELNARIEKMYLNHSDFSFVKILKNKNIIRKLYLKDIEDINIDIIFECKNIEELDILNCNVINSMNLNNLDKLKTIKIIGCKLDNNDIIEVLKQKIKVVYSKDKFFNVG